MNARAEIPLGLFPSMSIDDYHASAGISNSGLSDFARSPAHYYALHLDPARPTPEEKPGQLEGTLAHCALLEPATFAERFAMGPDVSRATKLWKTFEESVPAGQVAIKRAQHDAAFAMAGAARRDPAIASLLAKGQPEVSAYWVDELTGELCRCRPDWVHPISERRVILADVKTCSDAAPAEFARQIARKGYHRQAAFYSDGYARAAGVEVIGFVFIAIETEWPFACSAVMLDDESLARGRELNRELLARYAQCRETNTWPGYAPGISLVSLPAWAAT